MMKGGADPNILAYAEGAKGAAMRDRALELVQRLPPGAVVLPVQNVGRTVQRARPQGQPTANPCARNRTGLAGRVSNRGDVRAVMVNLLLSEDLQEGFTWRGVTVSNPFAKPFAKPHPFL